MKKGDLVRLNPDVCFTLSQGGGLQFPHTNYANDEAGIVEGFCSLTRDQQDELGKDDYYKGLDDGGEPRLVPSERRIALHRGQIYVVARARARATYNYRKISKLVKLLDTKSGKEIYIGRKLVEVVM